ncbi:hypothetical protein NMY22_g7182 [Coprinellus aureogranulatus]|nr:hypothetical protein NMY22_g7182 [Coprinellus aureogranulatus]
MHDPDHDSYMHDSSDDEFEPSADEDEDQDEDDSDSENGEVDSDDEDEAVKSKKVVCIFNKDQMASIHGCIADTVLPSWVEHPPTNLGEPSHGKLKAEQWLILFTVFFPLILPELWTTKSLGPDFAEPESLSEQLLDNFHSLVLCTNIVCASAVSPAMADEYTANYVRYRQSSAVLFPHLKPRPNHHYAMHNGDQMKFFGPLMKLSELGYERHNGRLQKVKTNGHPGDIDFTMLRQVCREGRLRGILGAFNSLVKDSDSSRPLSRAIGQASALLLPDTTVLAESEVPPLPRYRGSPKKLEQIPDGDYILILDLVNEPQTVLPIRHHADYPHPLHSRILYPSALKVNHTTFNTRTFSPYSVHPGNSCISFSTPGTGVRTGFIYEIWAIDVSGDRQEVLLIAPHTHLSPEDSKRSPYVDCPGLMSHIVYDERHLPRKDIGIVAIHKSMIQGHAPFLARPVGTFGIKEPTLVVVNSLHRFRL